MRKKTTVVLADEQTLFREARIARCEGTSLYRVVGHCGDGKTAARLIETLAPDVAILDLGLPRLYALSVIRRAAAIGSPSKSLVLADKAPVVFSDPGSTAGSWERISTITPEPSGA